MSRVPDRYIVRESSGYTLGNSARLITELLVLDSWYGYAVVWSSEHTSFMRTYYDARGWVRSHQRLTWSRMARSKKRAHAESLAAELNAEHEASILPSMQAALGEAVQALKGTGA